jgi:hypothetical protein
MFGVVGGTAEHPMVGYLTQAVPVTEEVLAASQPVDPQEVFRIAGRCAEAACAHFEAGGCSLGSRVVSLGMPVVDRLPRCAIRSTCRWWAEQGNDVCFRCPAVVTRNMAPSREAAIIAGPLAVAAIRSAI